jgi:putative nucleotidyltransferase with HDIG domain
MTEKFADAAAAARVELAVGQVDAFSILPSVAAQFLRQLNDLSLTPSSLIELVECDPALTLAILSLCRQQGLGTSGEADLAGVVLKGLSLRQIRDSILSAKVYGVFDVDNPRVAFRKDLTRHCLAVACCADKIAEILSPAIDPHLAYLAGLLHDAGKFALDEAMPKSFDRLVEEAKSANCGFAAVEQQYLGIDHTILGKRLAQKLRLPPEIILAVWLHHSNTGLIAQPAVAGPQARIAQIVELADSIVRRLNIGRSGSCDVPIPCEPLADKLGLTPGDLERVGRSLPDVVDEKAKVIGLDLPAPQSAYCDALHASIVQIAAENAKLFDETARLQPIADYLDFAGELLPAVSSAVSPLDVAAELAVRWQKSFQTGPVCLYLTTAPAMQSIEAVVVDDSAKVQKLVLNPPENVPVVPEQISAKFEILDAAEHAGWLLEQLEVKFDLPRTKLAPLYAAGETIGVIIFEQRRPAPAEQSHSTSRLGAAVLNLALSCRKERWFAERFARLLTTPSAKPQPPAAPAVPQPVQQTSLDALAEMAAGAAHELNNPLAVISGRAQLLAKVETDAEKKRILEQIRQNAGELSAIIDDLMNYANPPQPRPTRTAVKQILNEAIELAAQKQKLEHIDVQLDVPEKIADVYVDSAQIVSAIANIICNAIESYQAGTGPVNISAEQAENSVAIKIADTGCGMDAQTLSKATQPFFSARPAGRKRGMGLAHAQRLIQINAGSLSIASQPAKGATVTIALPCKQG